MSRTENLSNITGQKVGGMHLILGDGLLNAMVIVKSSSPGRSGSTHYYLIINCGWTKKVVVFHLLHFM